MDMSFEMARKEALELGHTGGPNEDFFLFEQVLQVNSIVTPPVFFEVGGNNFEHDQVGMINLFVLP